MEEIKSVFDYQAQIGLTDHLGSLSATDQLVKMCHILPGYRVLDVGSGAGRTPIYLAKFYELNVTGVDIHPVMVAHATQAAQRENLEQQVSFRQADAQDLPFEDDSFDAVIVECVTTFTQDVQRAVSEYVRVTKPGGFVGINEATYLQPNPPEEIQAWAAQEIAAGAQVNTAEVWQAFLRKAGLADVFGKMYPYDVKAQTFQTLKRYGLPDLLRVWSRSLKLYISSAETRPMFREGAERMPAGLQEYFGYGLYAGRKPDRPKNKH